MNTKIQWMFSLLLMSCLTTSAYALEYYDISQPGIAKIKLYVSAVSKSSKNDALLQHMKRQLVQSLFFNLVDSESSAEYTLKIDKTVESGTVLPTLASSTDTGFEPLTFGVRFKKKDEGYLKRKSAQVGNLMLKKLFGISGSLGSSLVFSENVVSETQVKTLYKQVFGDTEKIQVSFNLFSNFGTSWNPQGDAILYTAVTGKGSAVYMQGFRPLRVKSVQVFFDKGSGSAAEWGSNGRVFVSKYVNRSNTDIYVYNLDGENIYGEPSPKLRESSRITKNSAIETEPALSPDGKNLALISDRTGGPQVYIWDMQKKKMTRITKKGNYNVSPAWSPDGRFLAYSSNRGGVFSIYRIDVKTLKETRVTQRNINAESPTWSPDGSLIAFAGRKRNGDWKIHYSLSSGGKSSRLTNSGPGILETSPAWGPALR